MPIARSLLVGCLLAAALLPALAEAALVNINTADATALDGLPGIGPTKAAAIVDYRTQHGPFAAIADIQNVSGIGPSTYAEIDPFITVGDASADAAADSSPSTSGASSTAAQDPAPAARGSSSTHAPPAALTLDIGGDRQATLHTPVAFEAAVAAAGGAADTHATVSWAFGNGAAGAGYAAEALYDYPGTYLVAAKATDGAAVAHAKVTVVVSSASVRIDALSPAGVLIKNEGAADLDLSGWVLVEGAGNFRIPEGTWVAPGVSALFAPRATKLALSDTAILAYPDGSIAAAYPAAGSGAAQPVALVAGSPRVQTVGYSATQDAASPAFTSPNADDHATAPPAGADPGGAALGASTSAAAASAPVSGAAGGLLHSRWTLGALVAVMIGGGAFLIL